jgi:restriction system protein
MAEITKRRVGEYLRNLFEILSKHPEGLQARDALAQLETHLTLTDYEKGEYESGGRRFEKVVRFATVDCVKAGWLLKQKGKWFLTDEGRTAFQKIRDPEAFHREALRLYHVWARSRPEAGATDEPEVADSEKEVSITFERAEEQAWKEIEQHLRSMNPYEFQELVASLLRAMGYHVAWVAPPGKDGGIDILAWSDPLGTRPPRIKVQVKRHSSNTDVDGLRSFMALLGDDDVGLFVTTAGFTKNAQDEARMQEKRKITLVDLERLFDLWVEHYSKLDEPARRRLPLQPIHFLAPEA